MGLLLQLSAQPPQTEEIQPHSDPILKVLTLCPASDSWYPLPPQALPRHPRPPTARFEG